MARARVEDKYYAVITNGTQVYTLLSSEDELKTLYNVSQSNIDRYESYTDDSGLENLQKQQSFNAIPNEMVTIITSALQNGNMTTLRNIASILKRMYIALNNVPDSGYVLEVDPVNDENNSFRFYIEVFLNVPEPQRNDQQWEPANSTVSMKATRRYNDMKNMSPAQYVSMFLGGIGLTAIVPMLANANENDLRDIDDVIPQMRYI